MTAGIQTKFLSLVADVLPFIIGFTFISNEKDLFRLCKILVIQAGVIGLLCIIEYWIQFNPTVYFQEMYNPHSETIYTGSSVHIRGAFHRVGGIEGFPVQTSHILAFMFPITTWYAIRSKIVGKMVWLLCFAGLIMLQGRASIIGVTLSVLVIILFRNHIRLYRLFSVVVFLSLVSLVPTITRNIGLSLGKFFGSSMTMGLYGTSLGSRIMDIVKGISFFIDKPLTGHGSPTFVDSVLMYYRDLPPPILYAAAGGIFVFILYMLALWSMPYFTIKFTRRSELNFKAKEFLIFALAAFVAAVIMHNINGGQSRLFIQSMFFAAIYKVYGKRLTKLNLRPGMTSKEISQPIGTHGTKPIKLRRIRR